MGIHPGDLIATVQRLVEVEYKQEPELVPTPHPVMEEKTAANWDPLRQANNVTSTHAQVS